MMFVKRMKHILTKQLKNATSIVQTLHIIMSKKTIVLLAQKTVSPVKVQHHVKPALILLLFIYPMMDRANTYAL